MRFSSCHCFSLSCGIESATRNVTEYVTPACCQCGNRRAVLSMVANLSSGTKEECGADVSYARFLLNWADGTSAPLSFSITPTLLFHTSRTYPPACRKLSPP